MVLVPLESVLVSKWICMGIGGQFGVTEDGGEKLNLMDGLGGIQQIYR